MANQGDEVLLSDPNDSEFSGFDPVDVAVQNGVNTQGKNKKKTKNKQVSCSSVTAKSSTSKSTKGSTSKTASQKGKNLIDIDNLSPEDISKLQEKLGMFSTPLESCDFADEEDIQSVFGDTLNNMPNLHIEVSNEDSEEELASAPNRSKGHKRKPLQPVNIGNNLMDALFESPRENDIEANENEQVDYDFDWELPRLKVPEKGSAIPQSLANLINTACTSQCVTDNTVQKYKIPQNCEKLAAPIVNNEVWKILNKRAHSYDKCFADIQNLVAAGMVPAIKLAEILKQQISSNSEAKTLFSDMITLMGQVQYNLSLRRRYMIRPNLKKKYFNLCNINMPITTKLFGDDVARDIKNCETGISIAKDSFQSYRPYRGRGNFRGGFVRNQRGSLRYQPYPAQYQQGYTRGYGTYRGTQRGFVPGRGRRQMATATVSCPPNESPQ